MADSDQIRNLMNRVEFAGALAELSAPNGKAEGVTKDGVAYISFNGVIQVSENKSDTVRFRTFVKAKKSDGTDSKLYARVKDWYYSAVPMTSNPEFPTMFSAVGSISDNPYVNVEGKLIESTQYSLNLIGDFTGYKADVDLEGVIAGIQAESKEINGETTETGRMRMRLISRDMFGNTLDIKNIIIPADLANDVEAAGWELGNTAAVRMELVRQGSQPKVASGFGKQHITAGKEYLELQVVGGDRAYEPDEGRGIEGSVVKKLMNERASKLESIKAAGYQGGKKSGGSGSFGTASSGGFGKSAASPVSGFTTLADDEMPF